MRCGFGHRDGRTIAFAAQCGTATRPAGFRTAARLVRLADRLGIPVLTLVDTPGAANDAAAEQAGAGAAIADAFAALATAQVPVTSLLIGEGGSGGALALAAPDRLWATPDSYFSVIAPELAAAILKRDEGRSTTPPTNSASAHRTCGNWASSAASSHRPEAGREHRPQLLSTPCPATRSAPTAARIEGLRSASARQMA